MHANVCNKNKIAYYYKQKCTVKPIASPMTIAQLTEITASTIRRFLLEWPNFIFVSAFCSCMSDRPTCAIGSANCKVI